MLYSNVVDEVELSVPYLGTLIQAICTPLGIAVAFGVVFLMTLLNFLPNIFEEQRKRGQCFNKYCPLFKINFSILFYLFTITIII